MYVHGQGLRRKVDSFRFGGTLNPKPLNPLLSVRHYPPLSSPSLATGYSNQMASKEKALQSSMEVPSCLWTIVWPFSWKLIQGNGYNNNNSNSNFIAIQVPEKLVIVIM